MVTFALQQVPNAFRDRTRLRPWLTSVAKREGHAIAQLNYVLMTDKALLRYNQQYLEHDEYTDIITFDTSPAAQRNNRGPKTLHGDILISYDRVKENAAAFGVPAQDELHRVMVHGLLHLCGHGDKSAAQQKVMRKLEDKYLALMERP